MREKQKQNATELKIRDECETINNQHTFIVLEKECPLRSRADRGRKVGCGLSGLSAFAAAAADAEPREGLRRACITPVNEVDVALVSPRKWFAWLLLLSLLLLLLLLLPPPNPGTLKDEDDLPESLLLLLRGVLLPASRTP